MTWLEISVEVDREAVESVSALFAEVAYNRGVVVDEPLLHGPDGPDYQIDPQRPVRVRAYLPQDEQAAGLVQRVEQSLWALGMLRPVGELQVRELREEDWANAWKAYYRPQRIGRRFVVVPSWEEYPAQPEDLVLRLDPGMAFGTGLHPTTRLCLELIEEYAQPGMQALDLGAGSGILAVALAKMGLQVLALDNDPVAVEATQENVVRNGVQQQVTVREGSLGAGAEFGHWMGGAAYTAATELRTEPQGRFDLIAANILARVHVALGQDYAQALRADAPGGALLITSGIITERAAEVEQALAAAGLALVTRRDTGDWVAFVHRREER